MRVRVFSLTAPIVPHPAARVPLALAPWLALLAVVTTQGLWWTQRPEATRLLLEYLAIVWTVVCCAPGLAARDANDAGATRALLIVAAVLTAVGVEGSALGLNPFGCGVSVRSPASPRCSQCRRLAAAPRSSGVCDTVVTTVLALGAASWPCASWVWAQRSGHRQPRVGAAVQPHPPARRSSIGPSRSTRFVPALMEINARHPGPELTEPRADVLVIGDSFVEARQLPWEQTVGPRLQAVLDQRHLAGRVVSHGMRGWSPLLEWNWYLKVGRQLRPKDVFVFFFWNDLWTVGTETATFQAVLTPEGRPDHFDVPVDRAAIWYKHARLVRLSEEVWRRASLADLKRAFGGVGGGILSSTTLDSEAARRLAMTMAPGPALSPEQIAALLSQPVDALPADLRVLSGADFWPRMRERAVWGEALQRAADATALEFQRFAADVAADGARLHIVYVPNPYQVHPSECAVGRLVERLRPDTLLPADSGIQSWLRHMAVSAGIPFLDPTARMREFDEAQPREAFVPLYLRADCHWSPRGHQFMADYLGDFLATR